MDFSDVQISRPENWQKFESLCLDLFRHQWDDIYAQKNGRSGQAQHGTDISGSPKRHPHEMHGVQCKGKDSLYGHKVTERELRDEVKKALDFKPTLDHWILATTAPKDPKLEEIARLITVEHRQQGLFAVRVLGWEDLKNMISDSEEIMTKHYWNQSPKQQRILDGLQAIQDGQAFQSGAAANYQTKSMGMLTRMEGHIALLVDANVNDALIGEAVLQARVDDARDAIRDLRPAAALKAIERLEAEFWVTASDFAKFRVLINKSVALYALDDVGAAASTAIEALAFAPRDSRGIVFAAQGHHLLGRDEIAREMLAELLEREPGNEDALAVRIAVAFDEPGVEDPYWLTPQPQATGWNVTLSAARWYRHRGCWPLAIAEFRRALETQPERLEVITEVATAILEDLFRGRAALFIHRMTARQVNDFRLATELLEKAWFTAKKSEVVTVHVSTAANLSTAYRFLTEWDKARLLIDEALVLQPGNPALLQQRTLIAAATDDHETTIKMLDRIGSADPEAMLMRSDALSALRRHPEALAALEMFPSDCSPRLRIAAAGARVKLLVLLGREEEALSAAVAGAGQFPASAMARLLVSEYYRYTGNAEASLSEVTMASAILPQADKDDGLERMIFAEAFAKLEAWERASDLLAEVGGDHDCEPLRMRVEALLRAGRRTELRQLIERLPEDVAKLPFYTHAASWLYRLSGDYTRARFNLELYLPHAPRDLRTRMLWLDVVDRLGDPAAAKAFLAREFSFDRDNCSTRDLMALAQRLVSEGMSIRGLELGYQVLRDRWKNPKAHHPYLGLILLSERSGNHLPTAPSINLDTTFTVEDGFGVQHAYTIESIPDRNVELGEIDPQSDLARRASGRVVGDFLQVNDNPLVPSQKVVSVVHKYTGLFQRSYNQFSSLFPANNSMMSFRFDTSQPDHLIEQMRPFLSAQALSFQMMLDHYKQGMPIAFVASLLGRDPVDGWYAIWQSDVPVDVCLGTEGERNQAFARLRSASGLVLDPTTAWIAGVIGVLDQLEAAFGPLGIAGSTAELFEEKAREAIDRISRTEGAMAERDGRVIIARASDAEKQASAEFANKMSKWARERAVIVPAFSEVDLAPEARQVGEQTHRTVVDTIAAASGSARLLLCEDRRLRQLGEEVASLPGVWLQPALMFCLARGSLTRVDYDQAVTRLALMGHSMSALDDDLLVRAVNTDGWGPGSTFERLVKTLRSPKLDQLSLVRLAAVFIGKLWSLPKSRRGKENLTGMMLSACRDAHPTTPAIIGRLLAEAAKDLRSHPNGRSRDLRKASRSVEIWIRSRSLSTCGPPAPDENTR